MRQGSYTDCYSTSIPMAVSHAQFVEAFYTTAVFRLERLLLAWFVAKPSTDGEARLLAAGKIDSFAAWDVEARDIDQLLMRDLHGRTRSWLMVEPAREGGPSGTRLYFGSAVVPVVREGSTQPRMGMVFNALLGFHKLYSRVLLRAACSRLANTRDRG